MDKMRILIADAQRLFADSLAQSLGRRPSFSILHDHPVTGLDAVTLALDTEPDIAIFDYWLVGMRGCAATAMILEQLPRCRVIVLFGFYDRPLMRRARVAGADGCLLKDVSVAEVANALERMRARTAIRQKPPQDEGHQDKADDVVRRLARLSVHKIQLLELLNVLGRDDAVAEALGITTRTVRAHLYQALDVAGMSTRSELLAAAQRHHFISPGKSSVMRPRPALQGRQPEMMESGRAAISVLIADSQPLFSEALSDALVASDDLLVIDERPASALDAVDAVERWRPDVALVDQWLIGPPTHEVVAEMREGVRDCKVIVTSWMHNPQVIRDVLTAGAIGFLPKSVSVGQVGDAIRDAHRGSPLVYAPELAGLVEWLEQSQGMLGVVGEALSTLTPREAEVLGLLGAGRSISEIGRHLAISRTTVDVYIRRILGKLGVRSNAEAVALARRAGHILE